MDETSIKVCSANGLCDGKIAIPGKRELKFCRAGIKKKKGFMSQLPIHIVSGSGGKKKT